MLFVLLNVRNEHTDRFNPLLSKEISYAKVDKETQNYENIVIYDANGDEKNYKLSFKGYDPSQEYVEITHKGKYVESIKYITKLKFNKIMGK